MACSRLTRWSWMIWVMLVGLGHSTVDEECERKELARLGEPVPIRELPSSLTDVEGKLRFYRPEGTVCASGSDWMFGVLKKSPQKLHVFFYGGGGVAGGGGNGCWDLEGCCGGKQYLSEVDFTVRDVAQWSCTDDVPLTLMDLDGLFADRTENPLRDYSVLLLPYCSADHWLSDTNTSYGEGCTIEHRGSANAAVAINWALKVFGRQIRDVVFSGEGAGGYGAAMFAMKFIGSAEQLRQNINVTVLTDGAVGLGIIPPSWRVFTAGVIPSVFAKSKLFPSFKGFLPAPPTLKPTTTNGSAELQDYVDQTRAMREAMFTTKYPQFDLFVMEITTQNDTTQGAFYDISADLVCNSSSSDACNRENILDFSEAAEVEINATSAKFETYSGLILPGTTSGLLRLDSWYSESPTGQAYRNGSQVQQITAVWFSEGLRRDLSVVPDGQVKLSPTPSPSENGDAPAGQAEIAACFPHDAIVELDDGSHIPMVELRTGHRVRVDDGTFSDVFMFTHYRQDIVTEMVRLSVEGTTDSGVEVVLSASHYVRSGHSFGLVAADALSAGDIVWTFDRRWRRRRPVVVKTVTRVVKQGLYNPHTLHGDIIVNGLVTSSFTTAVTPPLARVLLAIPKALYRVGWTNPFANLFLHDNNWIADFLPRGSPVVCN